MQMQLRVDHIAFEVRNLEESAAFYGEVLGLKEIENRTYRETIRWFALDGHRALHLITGPDETPPERPINLHFCLSTPQFDATLELLWSKGVRYRNIKGEVGKFNHRGDGVRQAYFQDPDNYWIEVCEAQPDGTLG